MIAYEAGAVGVVAALDSDSFSSYASYYLVPEPATGLFPGDLVPACSPLKADAARCCVLFGNRSALSTISALTRFCFAVFRTPLPCISPLLFHPLLGLGRLHHRGCLPLRESLVEWLRPVAHRHPAPRDGRLIPQLLRADRERPRADQRGHLQQHCRVRRQLRRRPGRFRAQVFCGNLRARLQRDGLGDGHQCHPAGGSCHGVPEHGHVRQLQHRGRDRSSCGRGDGPDRLGRQQPFRVLRQLRADRHGSRGAELFQRRGVLGICGVTVPELVYLFVFLSATFYFTSNVICFGSFSVPILGRGYDQCRRLQLNLYHAHKYC